MRDHEYDEDKYNKSRNATMCECNEYGENDYNDNIIIIFRWMN